MDSSSDRSSPPSTERRDWCCAFAAGRSVAGRAAACATALAAALSFVSGAAAPALADAADSTGAQFVARFEAVLLPPSDGPALRRPSGVTTDFQGNVFVADTGNHRILQFDPDGRFVFAFGGYGWNDGELSSPTDASAREGFRLFVADAGNDRVQQFDIGDSSPEGFVFPFREGTGLGGEALVRPSRLDIDDEGRMYVSDSLCHCIWIFAPTGELVNRLGGLGDEPARFRDPAGVAVGAHGRVYVADAGNRRVQAFDALGNWIRVWGGPTEDLFTQPTGIDCGPDETVFVADRGAARILLLSAEGRVLFQFGGLGDGPGSFRAPIDVAVAPDGAIYVVDQERQVVERYRLVRDDAPSR